MAVPCRQSALRFLKVRPRSVAELKNKLERKGFEAQEIETTLQWLINTKLLNDRSFTKSWIQYRLARPFGFRRIIGELKAKGIADEIIEQTIAQFKEEYIEGDVILDLAKRRAQRLTGLEPLKRKKRIYDFLIRRGFAVGEVMKVIKKISAKGGSASG